MKISKSMMKLHCKTTTNRYVEQIEKKNNTNKNNNNILIIRLYLYLEKLLGREAQPIKKKK